MVDLWMNLSPLDRIGNGKLTKLYKIRIQGTLLEISMVAVLGLPSPTDTGDRLG